MIIIFQTDEYVYNRKTSLVALQLQFISIILGIRIALRIANSATTNEFFTRKKVVIKFIT